MIDDQLAELQSLRRRVAELEAQEVAERVAREAFHDVKSRFRALEEMSPVGIYQCEAEGSCLYVNEAYRELTGLTTEEALGRGWLRSVHPDDRERLERLWYGGPRPRLPPVVEYRIRRPGGEVLWVFGKGSVVRDGGGQVTGYLGAMIDITERREAEEERRRALEELEQERRMFLTGPVVVFKWQNAPGWPVEYVSPNVKEVLGYSVEDLETGRVPYASIIPEDDIERVAAEVEKGSRQGSERFSHEPYRIVRSDGCTIWIVDFTTVIRDAEGQATHYLGYILDITELKAAGENVRHLEARMRHAQKLESLGLFAGGIAHDFNNFLTGVLGNAGLVMMKLEKSSPLVPLVQEIEQAAEHASEVVDQMLTYAGKADADVTSFDVEELVREMEQLLRATISKKAELELRFAGGLPAIEGDPVQIRQALMNLVLNASDALGNEPGTLTIATEVVDADRAYLAATYLDEDLPEGRYVLLEISDTGCGMDERTRERLFDPFFTTKEKGRGLGMASVLGIVRQHGGAIKVYSEPGLGTSFGVHFPVAGETVAAAADEGSAVAAWECAGTILAVDDDPMIRRLAENVLRDFGFDVVVAEDGLKALESFRAHRGEVVGVLLDMTMPQLDGGETFRELRRIAPELKILLSSGFNQQQTRVEELLQEGGAAFIRKPYRPMALMEKLQALLEGEAE